eukprot:4353158-Karenia_brevis.AAC.1
MLGTPKRCFGALALGGILRKTISPGISCLMCRVRLTCSSCLANADSLALLKIPASSLKLLNNLATISVLAVPLGTMNGARVTSGSCSNK